MSAARLADLKQLRSNMKGDTLMTIEQLKKYRDICAEIEEIQQELDSKHYVADTVSVCTPPSYTAHSKRIDGFPPKGNTLSLLAELSTLRAQQRACEEWVNHIPSYRIRKAIELYYISPIEIGEDKPTWESIADKIGNGETSYSLKKAVGRYFQKCHECHTCHE